MVPNQIEREIVITAPVEKVWAALTEAEHIGTWFGDAGAKIDLRPDGLLSCSWQGHGTYLARIEHVDPPRLISFRWAISTDTEPRPGNSTLVVFTLAAEGPATRLRVVESGFRDLEVPDVEKTAHVKDNTSGWISELDELWTYLERAAA